jgi:hypothetical protein
MIRRDLLAEFMKKASECRNNTHERTHGLSGFSQIGATGLSTYSGMKDNSTLMSGDNLSTTSGARKSKKQKELKKLSTERPYETFDQRKELIRKLESIGSSTKGPKRHFEFSLKKKSPHRVPS